MDENSMVVHLAEIRARRVQIEAELAILTKMESVYEEWLAWIRKANSRGVQLLLTVPERSPRRRAAPGKLSARGAVLQVLQDAKGAPLHVRDIIPRILEAGAQLNAKNPEGWIDLMGYSLKKDGRPVEKVGPRTWRWAGNDADQEDAAAPQLAVQVVG